MFYSKEGFDKEIIRKVFAKIQEHHDALRMTYEINKENREIIQIAHGVDYPLSLEEYEINGPTGDLELLAERMQAGIDLEKGPLLKLGLFHLDDGDRLLIVIHHLVIDGVSWRILFEDIETLYSRYKRDEKPVLPPKTDSFKLWSETLSAYANSKAFLKEKTYWQQIESVETFPIPRDFEVEGNYIKDTGSVSFILKEEETELLLTRVNGIFRTEINDILLTALGMGIKKTFGHDRVSIALEAHGREEILAGIDISRTVGWFTALYPVLINMSYADDPGRQVKEVKETLRRIPNKGIGYGILKYLTREEHKKEIEFKLKPQISFNYLGQFDADVRQLSSFEPAKESPGNSQGPNNKREYLLDVSGLTANNRLTMTITFNKTHFTPGTTATLLSHFEFELKGLIAYCSSWKNSELTPADFTYKGLSIETIDRLTALYPDLEDLYTLTPMQEGMLFHTAFDHTVHSYFEQTSYRLQGDLNIGLVEKSLHELLKRHDILRTAFVYNDIERPVQVVLKERTVDFYFEDIRNTAGKENYIDEFKAKDRGRPFALGSDSLMRVAILRTAEAEYEFIWSFHHILMDGWCLGIINSEFFEIYNSFLENRPYRLAEVRPYRTYIQWLEEQDKDASARYWENYLDAFEEQVEVPGKKIFAKENNREYRNERVSVVLDREKTARLNKLAAGNHATLNTVTQAIWAILLGKYNGKEDVLFGAVVSGRPHGVEGVESMVGLFINTIPVRIRYEANMKFNRLVQKVQEQAIASEPYHYHPLAEIQGRTSLKQNLIGHIMIFENYPLAEQIEGYGKEKNKSSRITIKIANVSVFEQTNYDFNIALSGSDRLTITFQYNGNVYDGDYIARAAKHFSRIVDRVSENPGLEVRELTPLTAEEKNRILYEFNDTETEYPQTKTIHQLFAEQASRTPDHIALVGHVGLVRPVRLVQLSYFQLNEQSNRLAGGLIEKGVQADNIVGIMMQRSVEMIIGILGILKSGGAYMPIDPEYPQERIDYMLKDSGAKILLTAADCVFNFHHSSFIIHHSSHLAYLIYTSGTTGKPKGVAVMHRGVVNYISWRLAAYGFSEKDVTLQLLSYTFDGFGVNLYSSLLSGGKLVIVPGSKSLDFDYIKELVND
ncbi:MAG TPA: condensation domain-containing protein, partial [Candidatus Deferrimicrobium sp.]|nr:condensation domain-containing protein [Candidatus Deferrimicrobium sp.]